MFFHSQEPITDQETQRLKRIKSSFFKKIFEKPNVLHNEEQRSVDVYQASVLQCFALSDFNEELPLYVLDLGGMILVLFGQWMYDPHTLVVPKHVFESWNCEKAIFKNFSLRCLVAQGVVLQMVVEGTEFVEVQRLPAGVKFKRLSECQFIDGDAKTLTYDLAKAGLI